ncbi:MAG: hypothetical protein CV087_07980 [Candidatus Brocadia sp. WS118]|nr:MAG: hypothetical protein CV087_07980 [Candidatus Brocadia sp. WS118]
MESKRELIALILWWCEGTKPRRDMRWKNAYLYPIEIINSDPRIIRIFLDYLRDEVKVPFNKLRGQIQIHEGDNREEIEDFWSEVLKIPKVQFNKTIIRPKGNRFRNNHGTFKLRFYDRKTHELLQQRLTREIDSIQ